jgi:2-polyprenyl-3-methyl-5-hydroxy-6-metoxy-1,4-benzoquinol methylase
MGSNHSSDNQHPLEETREYWNQAAEAFDDAPDHGLREPRIHEAWTKLLRSLIPSSASTVLDLGCGTGSLSVVLASLGCSVTGIDLSPAMIAQAKAKAAIARFPIQFEVMDAAYPQFPPQQFDVLLGRHILWTLPAPDRVLQRWISLLKPGGRLLLIEGYWHTKVGLAAQTLLAALPPALTRCSIQNLSDQSDLWGGAVMDERYVLLAELGSP